LKTPDDSFIEKLLDHTNSHVIIAGESKMLHVQQEERNFMTSKAIARSP